MMLLLLGLSTWFGTTRDVEDSDQEKGARIDLVRKIQGLRESELWLLRTSTARELFIHTRRLTHSYKLPLPSFQRMSGTPLSHKFPFLSRLYS